MLKATVVLAGLLILLTGSAIPVIADIYMYVDQNGVTHFTNAPTSRDFQLFMKSRRGRGNRKPMDKTCYDSLIRRAASRYGVDFALIKAVIEVESAYDPRAVSTKGARGLMQIMPFNFRQLNISDPFEPAQNIMGGTSYLTRLIRQYDGNLEHALAAYNAGPSNVDKYKGIPPFPETRNYVRRVMALHRSYKGRS